MPNCRKATGLTSFLPFIFTFFVASSLPMRALAQGVFVPAFALNKRPCSGTTPIARAEKVDDRRNVEGDYVVIEYNEASRQAFWYDYGRHFTFSTPGFIDRNGSFLPVVDTKEKVAVHVCGLHFGDQLTVTTNPLVAPEGGADIRGATNTTQTPNLAASLDAIQNPSTTGSVLTGGNLGYSTTPALISPIVGGVTPGKFSTRASDGTATYSDGTITASGQQVALMMYATYMNAESLIASVKQFELRNKIDPYICKRVNGDDQAVFDPRLAVNPINNTPGSIDAIQKEMHLLDDCEIDHQSKVNDDAAAFDEDVDSTQILSGDITALASAIAAQGFGARAVAIQNNYAVLKGILDLSGYQGIGQPTKFDAAYPGCTRPPTTPPATPKPTASKTSTTTTTDSKSAQTSDSKGNTTGASDSKADTATTKEPATSTTTTTTRTVTVTRSEGPADTSTQTKTKIEPIPPATVACDVGEQNAFANFNAAYANALPDLVAKTPSNLLVSQRALTAADVDNFNPASTFEEIATLAADLTKIDDKAGDIFNRMNDWYRSSELEQTDLIAPATANYLMRVSIIVQRGYTPFTLASAPTPTGATVTATTAPAATTVTSTTTTGTAVTTGTPAHAVKTILVEVHRVANFNLAGGPVVMHVPTKSYSVVPGTVAATPNTPAGTGYLGTCGGTSILIPGSASATSAPAYSCVVQTQTTPWQVSAMVGVVWYPWRHDYFPRRSGFSNFRQNYYPSLLIATSVNTLGNALGAINFEPITGIDLFGGIGSANSTRLPAGVSLTTPVSSTYTFTGVTNVHTGLSLGIALDLGIFNQIFTKSQAASMP